MVATNLNTGIGPFSNMTLSEMQRALIHLTQLSTAMSLGKLEMKLSTAINIVARERFASLSREDWKVLLKETVKELLISSPTYDKHNIR